MRNVRQLFISGLLLLSCLVLAPSGRAMAQAVGGSFASAAEYEFGQRLRFYLAAESEDNVEQITLFFRSPAFAHAFAADVHIEEPARQLEVTHTVDLKQVRLAPFTQVTYWWVLATTTGQDIVVPEQTFVYEDDQFAWRTLSQDGVAVHWTGDNPGLGQLALDIVAESWPRLQSVMPVSEEMRNFNIYIYPSSADLRAALRLTGRDWVGAHADPELGVILVTAVNSRTAATDLRQSIPHELAHYLLYRITGSAYEAVPAWYNEGLATYLEKTPNPNYEMILARAVANQATIPFAGLCRAFPAAEEQALLAYAQSESLIRFIQANYGNQALRQLVAAFADGADCQTAIPRTLQLSLDELNQAWLRQQQPRSPLFHFLQQNSLLLLLLFGSFGVTALLIWLPVRTSRS